jgi:integrase
MTNFRLKYVHTYIDRLGKRRHYARLPGRRKVPLPGFPGSADFMTAYQAALAGHAPRPRDGAGAERVQPGTVSAAVSSYLGSAAFANLALGTQRMRRNILERFRREHGGKRLALLERTHIDRMVADKAASTPAAAHVFLKTVRVMVTHCLTMGLLKTDPTLGIKNVKLRGNGIHTWTENEIAAYRAAHPLGCVARLSLELLLGTGQRRGDCIGIGPQHVRDSAIYLRQRKTGAALVIPIHVDLAEAIAATASLHLTFLTRDGEPFTDASFGSHFRRWCNEAGLPKRCTAHGLRKAACRRLAEAGCSASEIMAISGHASLKELQKYVAAADQAQLARAAIAAITLSEPGTKIG